MKRFILILFIIMFSFSVKPVLAATTDSMVTPQAMQSFYTGYSSLSDNLDGTVRIYGYTKAYYAVDKIGINFHLQYYSSNGSWVTLRSYPYANYDSSDITKDIVISVSRGFNYRVLTEHYTLDNGVEESAITITDSIYIK